MAGAIIIQGDIDEIPGIAGVKERLLFLQASPITCPTDPSQPCGLSPNSARNQQTFQHFVNGRRNPTITIQPGETQRWRIANSSAFTFFRLKLDGHVMHQIAQDGNTLDVVVPHDEIVLGPAERVEVLIQGGAAGSYRFRTLPFDLQQGPGGLTAQEGAVGPDATLATLVSQGDSVARQALPTKLLPYVDLRNVPIDGQRRLISFQVQPNGNFDVNNLTFDPERVDQTMKLGTTEEWTIRNASNVWHPFHIHINPFQITAVNGRPYEAHGYKDTVSVPPQGEITFRTQFLDFTGQYVFHCHILTHEDSGMMQLIEVVD
jgi:FtsP/CotA-like multicopper oxidase with cupredoxin domain